MEPITITLLGVPVGKGRPRFSRKSGHTYTPERTRNFEASLRLAAQEAMRGRTMLDGPLAVRVRAIFPIPSSWSKRRQAEATAGQLRPTTKPDLDNLLKVVDALNQVVWTDDKLIVSATVQKFYGAQPMLEIAVRPVMEALAA